MNPFWEQANQVLPCVLIGDTVIARGSRVLLHPKPGGDIIDMALDGKVASVEAVEQDFEDRVYIAVTLPDDPGRDLGQERQPGHRFFFSVEEVVPLEDGGEEQQ